MKTSSLLRPGLAALALAIPAAALGGTKTAVVPYAPLYDSIPRATGERFSGYLLDSLRNNDSVEVVDLPGETEAAGGGSAGVSKKAATPEQRAAVAAALEDIQKGKALLKKRNVKPAFDAFARAVDALEKNGPAVEDSAALVDAHMKKAVCLYFMGREDEASKVNVPTALRLKPDLQLKVGTGEDEYGDKFVARFEEVRKGLIAAGSGDLRVDTAPPNAKIWIDNRETPPSPVVVKGLVPGIHYVTIKLPGTDPYVQAIEVKKGALARITPDEDKAAGSAKSAGMVAGLLSTLNKNVLDPAVMAQLKTIAAKSGAEIVVFGGAYAKGKDMGIATFLYNAKKGGIVELAKVTTDRDLLGVTVDINNLANQIYDRLKTFGDTAVLPRPVADDAKAGEEQVNETDFAPILVSGGAPKEKGEGAGGPKTPVRDRTPVKGPIRPITVGGGGARPEEAAAAPAASDAAPVAAAAATEAAPAPRNSRLVVAAGSTPPPPPPAVTTPAPAPAAAPPASASTDDLDLGLGEDKPAEAAPDPDAAKKAKLAKVAGNTIEDEYKELKIMQDSGLAETEQVKTESKGFTDHWWFWPAVGVVAAGAVTTGVVMAGGSSETGAKPVFKF